MGLKGKWHIVEMPDFEGDYPDMVGPPYFLFEDKGRAELVLGCRTGHMWAVIDTEATSIDFWIGNDEMDETSGDGSGELQPDGSLHREIQLHNRHEYAFIAQKWTSSIADLFSSRSDSIESLAPDYRFTAISDRLGQVPNVPGTCPKPYQSWSDHHSIRISLACALS